MRSWLDAALSAAEAGEDAVLISICHHPPLLPVPLGPVCVVTHEGEFGTLQLGAARRLALDACRERLGRPAEPTRDLSLTLNPWAGGSQGHTARLQLRKLTHADAPALGALQRALALGQSVDLSLAQPNLSVTPAGGVDALPLSAQAVAMRAEVALFHQPQRTVLVLGAGVLAHRVVECLADTPVRVCWSPLGGEPSLAAWPANAVALDAGFVPGTSQLPEACHALVMTHDHALDIDLCHRLLAQGQAGSVGMVGSHNKRGQLERVLAARGIAADDIARVRCPLGGANHSNLEHASVAIAAELLNAL